MSVRSGAPAAEVLVDAPLVRTLLVHQHPDLADLPLQRAAHGWDNEIFRLGEEFCIRLPRRAVAAASLMNEQRWLPILAPGLSLPVPSPLRTGHPQGAYPWHWNIVPWFDADTADEVVLDAGHALGLAEFLRSLHIPAPLDAPRNPVRGCLLADRSAVMEMRVARLQRRSGAFDAEHRSIWQRALAEPLDGLTWIHGDLHPGNVLVDDAGLVAVIDWGDMGAGDRATDLAGIWTLLESAADRRRAMAAYGVQSKACWRRARGWAVLLGVLMLDSGLDGNERFARLGASTLRRVAVELDDDL